MFRSNNVTLINITFNELELTWNTLDVGIYITCAFSPILHPIRLLRHQWEALIILSLGLFFSPNKSSLSFRLWTVSLISFSLLRERFLKRFYLSEGEALQELADLHGEGDKSNELLILEYEEMRQQANFCITDKIQVFNGTSCTNPIPFRIL